MRAPTTPINPNLKVTMDNSLSKIRVLTDAERGDMPIYDDLDVQITYLLNCGIKFSDILIHEDSPIMLRLPSGLVAVSDDSVVDRAALKTFFEVIEPNWEARIAVRAFDRSKNLESARIRANCFTFNGKKQYGCVIRRFPKQPVPLADLGLHADECGFAQLTSGLVLIIGDTCQGKSTTIASILDEINKNRSGHIITIEDPVETLIPQRHCMVTQREVGVDGDVESYYMGALDALRERPDVIVIGEIRDAQTAQEALSLGESGPLVIASLHARTTELGLSKMLRLLGNSESQSQALAHSVRGVLCQSLLPAADGSRYYLATECLTANAEISHAIATNYLTTVREAMIEGRPNCHTMNSVLIELLRAGKVKLTDAANVSTDRVEFMQLTKAAGLS